MTVPAYLDSLFSLAGRVALVTGGSSGIGQGIAQALAAAGAKVVVIARDEDRLQETTDTISQAGGQAGWVAADLRSRSGVRAAAEKAVGHFGEPDIVVSSAGVNIRPPLGELTDEVWDETMRLNLEAPFVLGQRFGPRMAERGFGRLIQISSQQAHRAFVNSGAYGVSKGGLEALARSQAEAWSARGVTSNVLVPGFVPTRLNTRIADDPVAAAAMTARTMSARMGRPEDFAGVAVLLASEASSYITGQSIFVDGGMSRH
jgi:NAD(P)-dependent dehydrogenase (short-subunit alcohol dehydrogenase family)